MKGLETFGDPNKPVRAARLKVPVVLLLLVFACVFAARRPTIAQQDTAEVCRETKKVMEQYKRESDEAQALYNFKTYEEDWRGRLSELRRAIAEGYVAFILNDIASQVGLPKPVGSTKEKLAVQKTARDLLERKLQVVRDLDADDLLAQHLRLSEQVRTRLIRMRDLNCEEVLKRAETDGKIQVVSGTYGANCRQSEGNVTWHLAAECNGKTSCTYVIDYNVIKDPIYGCAKNYIAKWRCGSESQVHTAEVAAEAGYKKTVALSCGN